jgi:hypothetical protein
MDRDRFDAITRVLAAAPARRDVLALLAGSPLALLARAETAEARRNKHKKKKRKRKGKPCYPGKSCVPGAGRDASGCDFSHSTQFADRNVQGANLRGSSFFEADLSGADFRGASLRDACFLGANLLGARIDGASLRDAVFCQTVMPDGAINDSGCDQATGCCSACPGEACVGWKGCTPIENLCVVIVGRPCCPNSDCEKIVQTRELSPTSCQSGPCTSDEECAARFPNQDVFCETDTFKCSGFRSSCCKPKPCSHDDDCAHSGLCCQWCCAPGQICTPTGCYGGTSS